VVKRKSLGTDLTLLFTEYFPYVRKTRHCRKHKVLLGIGGNVGDVVRRFEHLFHTFQRSVFVSIVETSPILKNPPFGFLEQDDFYNAVVLVETNLTPRNLLRYLLQVEKRYGRKRLFKDGPRTLDIDMIFYEDVTMESKVLTLPHPGWMQRSSVLIPLSKMKRRF